MRTTLVETVNAENPDPAAIRRAADAIRRGELVAFPTETVYGLGANALDALAVGRIFTAKGRPAINPVIVHIAEAEQAKEVATSWPDAARKLAAAFWPGPLTLVLPKRVEVPDAVTAAGPTVAVRCPAHPVAIALIRAASVPIAAPSANRSGELSPTTAVHVLKGLDGRIEMLLDGGPCSGGVESTVVDVSGSTVTLLRPGLITVPMLEKIVGEVSMGKSEEAAGPLPSPGMLAKHYSPHTALEVAESAEEAAFLANLYETAGLKVARWSAVGDPVAVAARLYAELHEFDGGGYDRIIAALPPMAAEWAAVRDRLTRAAAE